MVSLSLHVAVNLKRITLSLHWRSTLSGCAVSVGWDSGNGALVVQKLFEQRV